MEFRIVPTMLQDGSVLDDESKQVLRDLYVEEGDAAWETVAGDDPLDERRLARNSYTLEELEAQPACIRETVSLEREAIAEVARAVCKTRVDMIYLLGCGDSLAALRGERFFLESLLGIPCREEDPLDFCCYNSSTVNEHTLVLGLSSSGRTIRIVEALLKARALGAQTIALTNSPESPLARIATCKVLIHASRKGWPTQSSTSAMAAVVELGLAMARCLGRQDVEAYAEDFARIPDLMAETIEATRDHMRDLAERLFDRTMFFFCGAGPFFTCAEFGSAKVKEATPSYAMPVLLEEFHHYNTVKAGDPLFLIAPPGESPYRGLETILACHQLGGEAYVLTGAGEKKLLAEADDAIVIPEVRECFANFLYSVPLQQFGYYLSTVMERKAREEIAGA